MTDGDYSGDFSGTDGVSEPPSIGSGGCSNTNVGGSGVAAAEPRRIGGVIGRDGNNIVGVSGSMGAVAGPEMNMIGVHNVRGGHGVGRSGGGGGAELPGGGGGAGAGDGGGAGPPAGGLGIGGGGRWYRHGRKVFVPVSPTDTVMMLHPPNAFQSENLPRLVSHFNNAQQMKADGTLLAHTSVLIGRTGVGKSATMCGAASYWTTGTFSPPHGKRLCIMMSRTVKELIQLFDELKRRGQHVILFANRYGIKSNGYYWIMWGLA